ncbi:MAG: ELM1/GtrOC1 family putative glycosyltransferase [Pseudomonadales bacterium]
MSPPDISTTPVWVLKSYRAGENSQLLGLAERLGLPFRTIEAEYTALASSAGLSRRTTLAGIRAESRRALAPPWPRLLISAGLRNEPVAQWVRRASGGQTRLVFIGRTWCSTDCLDLLVTTPQYRIPPGPRVQVNLLTQHRVTKDRLAAARGAAHALLDGLIAPVVAVLVGGSSGPWVLGPRNAAHLAAALHTLVESTQASIVISTSARTPAAFTEALARELPAGARLYEWRRDDPGNPYFAMLAKADALVVSGDSVAMLSEAAATGKPVLIWDVPMDAAADASPAALGYRLMMRWLPARLTRDVGMFHRAFLNAGLGLSLADGIGALRLGRWPARRVGSLLGSGDGSDCAVDEDGTIARLAALLAQDGIIPPGVSGGSGRQ